MIRRAVWCVALALFALNVPASSAQDVNAMAKWTAATVVHYKILGEFKGKTRILTGKTYVHDAEVTDRVEIELDWDQMAYKLVGRPVIRNTPTVVGPLNMTKGCPPSRIDSPPEYVTVTAVTAMSTVLMMEQTRKLGAARSLAWGNRRMRAAARCGTRRRR